MYVIFRFWGVVVLGFFCFLFFFLLFVTSVVDISSKVLIFQQCGLSCSSVRGKLFIW